MKRLAGGSSVIEPHEGDWKIEGLWRFRTPISARMGAERIAQIESRYSPGLSPGRVNPGSEEVHYVVTGRGQCFVDGFSSPLQPGSGVFVPKGAEFAVENERDSEMIVVSVTCPEEKPSRVILVPRTVPLTSYQAPQRVVVESEREEIPTGDRRFRVLVDQDLGCREVTQFIGFIPKSKAPQHSHNYEEAIFILEGEGFLWAEDEQAPFRPGTSIHLPKGARHAVENRGEEPVRLLGVFSPPGSPAS